MLSNERFEMGIIKYDSNKKNERTNYDKECFNEKLNVILT